MTIGSIHIRLNMTTVVSQESQLWAYINQFSTVLTVREFQRVTSAFLFLVNMEYPNTIVDGNERISIRNGAHIFIYLCILFFSEIKSIVKCSYYILINHELLILTLQMNRMWDFMWPAENLLCTKLYLPILEDLHIHINIYCVLFILTLKWFPILILQENEALSFVWRTENVYIRLWQ